MKVESEALTLASHDFSFSLYMELAKSETENIFFSPFSIHMIMFIASNGATSKTFDEMIDTLHLNKTINFLEVYQKLLELLTWKNDHLKIANGIFVDFTFNVEESFVEKSRNYLKTSVEKLNFKNEPETQRQFINDWVLNKTNNKISELFPEGSIDTLTTLVLANAMHFKGGWANALYAAKDEPFFLTLNNQVTVKMMSLKKHFAYCHDDLLNFGAIQLPYDCPDYSMIILLPDAKDGLIDLENNFSKIKLHEIVEKMTKYEVDVKLPRFKIEQSMQLKETLTKLGCPTMFTTAANFSNMVENGVKVFVSNVWHKAIIDVDEKGTEAGAATGLLCGKVCARVLLPQISFVVNHPFIFSIMYRNSDILFLGRLVKF